MKIVVAFLLLAAVGCGQEHTRPHRRARRLDPGAAASHAARPAGYLVIQNRGGEPVALVAVETEAAEQTEIHVMEYKDDRMTMRRVSELQVPAGEEVALKPGGTHLMLMELRQPLRDGDEVELVLRFGDGTERRVPRYRCKRKVFMRASDALIFCAVFALLAACSAQPEAQKEPVAETSAPVEVPLLAGVRRYRRRLRASGSARRVALSCKVCAAKPPCSSSGTPIAPTSAR